MSSLKGIDMSTTTSKGEKPKRGTKTKAKTGITLPDSTTTVEIGGATYFVTPTSAMKEWLEDVEDILESRKALDEPGESVPFDKVVEDLGLGPTSIQG